jgi:DNA mismatch repair protein MutH
MRLDEALPVLRAACGKPFKELFIGHPENLRTNKGNVGQLLLIYAGLGLDSNLTDFDDGELKTNKANSDGSPLETMFITQISKNIDTFIGDPRTSFEESNLYKKTKNLIYLPVVKHSASTADWYFTQCVHIQITPQSSLYKKMREDYEAICDGLKHHIESSHDGFIHTTNGPHYVQVRSKDSKPYHPIYSTKYGRYVSNKNHALYFMKSFMNDALNGKL